MRLIAQPYYTPTADKRQVITNQSESANHKGHAWKKTFTKKKEKNPPMLYFPSILAEIWHNIWEIRGKEKQD